MKGCLKDIKAYPKKQRNISSNMVMNDVDIYPKTTNKRCTFRYPHWNKRLSSNKFHIWMRRLLE